MKEENIHRVLEIGIKTICLKGYHHLGLRDLLEEANIPSGSFYYYFKSKEDFAMKVAEFYGDAIEQYFRDKLLKGNRDYLQRFNAIFDEEIIRLKKTDFKEGCVLGDLSTEIASQMDDIRQMVEKKYQSWQSVIQQFFEEGKNAGLFKKDFDSEQMAIFFLSNRQGALTRVKSSHSIKPYEVFKKMTMKSISA